jgi:hypothetical protein
MMMMIPAAVSAGPRASGSHGLRPPGLSFPSERRVLAHARAELGLGELVESKKRYIGEVY